MNSWEFIQTYFMNQGTVISINVPYILDKKISSAFGQSVLQISFRSIWLIALFKSYIFLVIFCQNVLSIVKSGVLNYLTLCNCILYLFCYGLLYDKLPFLVSSACYHLHVLYLDSAFLLQCFTIVCHAIVYHSSNFIKTKEK